MKILMVNKFLYPNGGSETYIFKLGECLMSMGHEVEFFGMEHEGRCVGNSAAAYTTDMDFHGGSKLAKLTYPIKTIYSAEARKKIRLVLDKFCPDVVHINNFNYQLTPSIILEVVKYRKQTNRNCKIVYTAHDGQLVCPNHLMQNPCTGELCKKCLDGGYLNCLKGKCIHGSTAKSAIGMIEAIFWDALKTYKYIDVTISPSEFLAKKLSYNVHLDGKIKVFHNFIVERKRMDVAKEDYVLYFGRFSKEKGIATLIEVCKELPDVKFVFAGNGPLEDELAGVANIENVGFKSGEDLELLIRKARFSIHPSECYENCPFSVMESQMYGTPVIGADIGGIPELIDVGKTGELFESGNSIMLRDKIMQLINDEDKLNKYIENCKDIKFDTLREYCEKLIDIYKEL